MVHKEGGEQTVKKWREITDGIKEEMWVQEADQRITHHSQWSHDQRSQKGMECGQSSPSQRHHMNKGWRKPSREVCREGLCLVEPSGGLQHGQSLGEPPIP